jgi:hypothetical protein
MTLPGYTQNNCHDSVYSDSEIPLGYKSKEERKDGELCEHDGNFSKGSANGSKLENASILLSFDCAREGRIITYFQKIRTKNGKWDIP